MRAITNTVLASGVVTGSGSTCALTIPANTTVSNRTVTFQYLLNGTWTTIDRRTQLPTPQITKATVSPEGNIAAKGQTMTVTLWGVLPTEGVIVQALDGSSELARTTVRSSGQSATIQIPESTTAGRSVTFQYFWNNQWKHIATVPQAKLVHLVAYNQRMGGEDAKKLCRSHAGQRPGTQAEDALIRSGDWTWDTSPGQVGLGNGADLHVVMDFYRSYQTYIIWDGQRGSIGGTQYGDIYRYIACVKD